MTKELIALCASIAIALFGCGVSIGAWAEKRRRNKPKPGDGRDLVCLPGGGIATLPRRRFRL